MGHTCHAKNCKVEVLPTLLMCARHWKKVSKKTQNMVWFHYREGQCDDKSPSKEWLDAADKAIEEVFKKENEKLVKKQ